VDEEPVGILPSRSNENQLWQEGDSRERYPGGAFRENSFDISNHIHLAKTLFDIRRWQARLGTFPSPWWLLMLRPAELCPLDGRYTSMF